jgi:hypothetical protein
MTAIYDTYDPYPDAIAFLLRRSPLERHAIARVLDLDGTALAILQWLVDRPDCDLATAAMIFWRVRTLPSLRSATTDTAARNALLETVIAKVRAGRYGAPEIAWDGYEAWSREPLIGAAPLGGIAVADTLPDALSGPFGSERAEPATHAFLDEPYDADDIFDSLWRIHPKVAAAADWLIDRPAHDWMAAVDDLLSSHPEEDVFPWMLRQPECPRSVAGQIFWLWGHGTVTLPELEGSAVHSDELVALILERWRLGNLVPCDLDFSCYANPETCRELNEELASRGGRLDMFADLLDPHPGRKPPATKLGDDFDAWLLGQSLEPRPRSAAIAQWRADRRARGKRPRGYHARIVASSPGLLETLFYGGKFTGAQQQIDRCWKQFNLVMLAGGLLLIALMRGGAPKSAFWVFLALVAVLSIYQSSANLGGLRRVIGWWIGATTLTFGLAFLFRWIDKGVI